MIAALNMSREQFDQAHGALVLELRSEIEDAAARGFIQGTSGLAEEIGELLTFVREGVARQSVLDEFRKQVYDIAQRSSEQSREDTRKAISSICGEARAVISGLRPRLRISLILAALTSATVIASVAFLVFSRIVSDATFNEGYAAGARERMMHEATFYGGLDTYTQSVVDRRNGRLAVGDRLYFHEPKKK
jgi:hypothetical protein